MATRQQIVTEARSWLGTRWQHQASVKGVASDCVGLIRGVGISTGVYPENVMELEAIRPFIGYGRGPLNGQLAKGCLTFGILIDMTEAQPGDVVLMAFDGDPSHMGILGDYPHGGLSLIHAYAPLRKVVECRLDEVWLARIVSAYRLPGVTA